PRALPHDPLDVQAARSMRANRRRRARGGETATGPEKWKLLGSADEGVGGLVVGLPLSMDGSEGPRCQSVRQFAANLLEVFDIPVAFWDERLSTAAVERILVDEADMPRRRRAALVDKMAAAYILQGALDARTAPPM
ncbi:MAG: Holliday junction resolvase RuvX, partial [Rhodospirillales bacterium]|nr:Holliday junction resolvase RuvX [Rhodospirillales bacterium]